MPQACACHNALRQGDIGKSDAAHITMHSAADMKELLRNISFMPLVHAPPVTICRFTIFFFMCIVMFCIYMYSIFLLHQVVALSKRSKEAEAAFLSVYKQLIEAPGDLLCIAKVLCYCILFHIYMFVTFIEKKTKALFSLSHRIRL